MTTIERAGPPWRLAILLGPYRNLSTLTAATLALHPEIQVLNHAAERLLVPSTDFMRMPSEATLGQFMQSAVEASEDGDRGNFGGSILHSHAFDDAGLMETYRGRFGPLRVKPDASVLVWKDSMRVQNRLMAKKDTIVDLIEGLPAVSFVLPIRNPLACARSNMRTGHVKHLLAAEAPSLDETLEAVLRAHAWVLRQRDRWPDRFLVFTETDAVATVSRRLCEHLGVSQDQRWDADFARNFRPRTSAGPAHDPHADRARRAISLHLAPWPSVRDALLA